MPWWDRPPINYAPAPGAPSASRCLLTEDDRFVATVGRLIPEAMPALFELLESEAEPAVRAVLGHWLFGYIHPYMDGNGRMARFLMNAMLASGGYPWTIVPVEDRTRYLGALDNASIDLNIEPFAAFLAERVAWSINQAQRN